MCNNEQCKQQLCELYDTCWFLKIICDKCKNKVDVRDYNKDVRIQKFEGKEYEVEENYCPICNRIIGISKINEINI